MRWFGGALALMAEAQDELLSNFAVRLRDRKLFKCIDIRIHLGQKLIGRSDAEVIIDRKCATIKGRLEQWSQERGNEGKVLLDEASRSPYKKTGESEGPPGRINIRTSSNLTVDLKEQSSVVAAVKPFRLFRVYVDTSDEKTQQQVKNIIDLEVAP